jgi:hypothetical protein
LSAGAPGFKPARARSGARLYPAPTNRKLTTRRRPYCAALKGSNPCPPPAANVSNPLERHQPRGRPWVVPIDAYFHLMVDLGAVTKGRACWVPRPPSECYEETRVAFDLAMREYDSMHARLTAETPKAP